MMLGLEGNVRKTVKELGGIGVVRGQTSTGDTTVTAQSVTAV